MRRARVGISLLFALTLLVLGSVQVFAETYPNQDKIVATRNSILTVRELAQSGVITSSQAEDATNKYLASAANAAGRKLTLPEVLAVKDQTELSAIQNAEREKVLRFFYTIDVVRALAVIIGLLFFAYLLRDFIKFLIRVLDNIPLWVWEIAFYVMSLAILVAGYLWESPDRTYVGFVGAMSFGGSLVYSSLTRRLTDGPFKFFGTLFVVYSIIALAYNSSLVGFFAVACLLAALGFSHIFDPISNLLGFEEETNIGIPTTSAFTILALFVVIRMFGVNVPYIGVFEFGSLLLGSIVGFGGLWWLSTRWGMGSRDYVFYQVNSVGVGLFAIIIGSFFGILELQRVGGTFLVVYVFTKFAELPMPSLRWYAGLGLSICTAIFVFFTFAQQHPALFSPYLVFVSS